MDKFDNAMRKQNPAYHSFLNSDRRKWILNISNKNVPNSVLNFLSLGENFSLPMNPTVKKDRLISTIETIKNFEFNSHKVPENIADKLRNNISNSLQKFLRRNKHQSFIDRTILNDFSACKKFLRNNNDIFVTRANKGQVTVILDKKTYIDQMMITLDDSSTYRKLMKDPTRRISNRLNELLKTWLDNGIIEKFLYKKLICTNGNLPRYGLPKIHKTGFPLRIIVSAIGSPLYNVACFMHEILFNPVSIYP